MPTGIPNLVTKEDLRQRMRELEERLKQWDRREKALGDLKKWLAARKLGPSDVLWMYRQMQPKRAAKPVKSRKPLKPAGKANGHLADGADPAFMAALRQARRDSGLTRKAFAKKLGVSFGTIDNWVVGRNVPQPETYVRIKKEIGLD